MKFQVNDRVYLKDKGPSSLVGTITEVGDTIPTMYEAVRVHWDVWEDQTLSQTYPVADLELLDHTNIFQPLLDRYNKNGEFDEDAYWVLMDAWKRHGVEDFINLLKQTLCTYPAINDFIIQCLVYTNDNRDSFDT